jgi:hypothetical protein
MINKQSTSSKSSKQLKKTLNSWLHSRLLPRKLLTNKKNKL